MIAIGHQQATLQLAEVKFFRSGNYNLGADKRNQNETFFFFTINVTFLRVSRKLQLKGKISINKLNVS